MVETDVWASEYSCIAADPPWNEQGGGKTKRGADRWYPLIKTKEDILLTMVLAPCWRPAVNSHLWLWVTNNHLPDGLWLMGALGFKYKTNIVWTKMELVPPTDGLYRKQRHGLGQYLWGEHELLLFGTRGAAMLPPTEGRPGTHMPAPRTQNHSEKPAAVYSIMEFVTPSPGPRLEMFAVQRRHGWDAWGPQAHR